MNRRILIGAIALYLLGAVLHLGVFRNPSGTIWGDAGDGFFNLWVLNHTVETLSRGDVNLADGRIFWPRHNDTFFWSDNLLAVAPFFALSRLIKPNLLDAFRLTGLFLSMLHFGALLFLFHQVFALARSRQPDLSPYTAWWIPVLAYLAHFSPAVLINHFLHIQNLCSFGLFILVGAMLAYRCRPAARWLYLMTAALVFMLYSTPYYAVAGFILLATWLGFEAARDARELGQRVWTARWGLIALFIPAAILAAAYFQTERVSYLHSDIKTLSVDWSHLVVPAYGYIQQRLGAWITDYPRLHNEKIAWLGPGLLIGLVAMLGWSLRQTPRSWRTWIRSPLFWATGLSVVLLQLKIRELRPFLSIYGVIVIGVLLVLFIRYLSRRYRDDAIRFAAGYLVVAAVLMYGIAFGPHGYYLNTRVNPSVWGFLALWAPGLTNIRAVGRMAFIGQVLIFSLVALWIWIMQARSRGPFRRVLWVGLAAGCVLQGLDASTIRVPRQRHDASIIQPTAEEHAFFDALDGAMVVFPAHPYSRNTVPMLYFSRYPDLRLMNGYSARSTFVWDQVMWLGRRYGPCSPEQIRYVLNQGVDYVAVRTEFIRPAHAEGLKERAGEPLFENHRWAVYDADRIKLRARNGRNPT